MLIHTILTFANATVDDEKMIVTSLLLIAAFYTGWELDVGLEETFVF